MVSEYFPNPTRFLLENRYRSLSFTFSINFFGGDEELVVISSFVY